MSKHFICLVFLLAIFCVQGFADEMKLHVEPRILCEYLLWFPIDNGAR